MTHVHKMRKHICGGCGKYFCRVGYHTDFCDPCRRKVRIIGEDKVKIKCDKIQEGIFCGEYADVMV